MPLAQEQVLNNRYRIIKLTEQAEFGAIYSAWDLSTNSPCILEEIADASEAAQLRFTEQAQQLYRMQHPRLPKLLEAFGIPGQGLYMVFQQVEGEDLQTVFDRTDGPLPLDNVLPLAHQVCDGLNYLHTQTPPIVHGNLRPSSILVTEKGEVVLIGMGVAAKYDAQAGVVAGARAITPGFSSPEFYGKGKIEPRSDVYSLGATLYYLLAAKRLPESVLIRSHDVLPPKSPQEFNPQITPAIAAAIMRAVQVDPTERFPDIIEFKKAILGQSGETVVGRPVKPPVQRAGVQPAAPSAAGRGRGIWLIVGLAAVLLLVILLVGGGLLARSLLASNSPTVTAAPTTAVAVAATQTRPADTATQPPATATFTPLVLPSPTTASGNIEDPFGVPMVLIPAGEFLMGDNLGGPEEQPEHNVNLDSYYIDLYEVTNARYAACVADNSCDPPTQLGSATRSSYYDDPDFADFPVIFVNWAMAGQYCAWRGGSLPTEAQWEKAARGSDARVFPWPGEVIDCTFANFWNSEATCQRDTTAVGSYPKGASPFGLFDMAGNVWEWVQDWFSPDFYINSPADNPVGPADGGYRVLRGGGWTGSAGQQRTTTRGRNLPTGSWNYVGFRCVRTP